FQQDLNADGFIGTSELPRQFTDQGKDTNGVELYNVSWYTSGLQPFAVRVLSPDNPSVAHEHSFIYVMPVEAGLSQATYGDGLDVLRQLNAQNNYNATIIEPIFPITPWYANNPHDETMNYESFMSMLLPECVDSDL